MTDTDSPLAHLQRHAAACDDGIAAAERGMAEELLVAYHAGYADRRAAWLLCRAAVDRRMAELSKPKRRARRRLEEVNA